MTQQTFDKLVWFGAIALIVVAALLAVNECHEKRQCRDHGGRVVEYDCYERIQCNTVKTGSNHSSTSCHPVRTCSWRCESGPTETR